MASGVADMSNIATFNSLFEMRLSWWRGGAVTDDGVLSILYLRCYICWGVVGVYV